MKSSDGIASVTFVRLSPTPTCDSDVVFRSREVPNEERKCESGEKMRVGLSEWVERRVNRRAVPLVMIRVHWSHPTRLEATPCIGTLKVMTRTYGPVVAAQQQGIGMMQISQLFPVSIKIDRENLDSRAGENGYSRIPKIVTISTFSTQCHQRNTYADHRDDLQMSRMSACPSTPATRATVFARGFGIKRTGTATT